MHGPVRLGVDAEALVGDPSFRDGPVGARLERLAERFGLALSWHRGVRLGARDVPAGFCGPEVRALAERVATELGGDDMCIDAEIIGRAARRAAGTPSYSADQGDRAVLLQQLKLLWRVLVAHGRPAVDGTTGSWS